MLNLVQIQDRLKDMPTQAVMSYANGSNPMVPPYLALGELNRRKNMTQMATAEQAKMQGEQPTVKESTEQQLGLMNLQKQRAMQAQQGMGRAMANSPSPVPAGVGEEPVQMARGGIARLPVRNLRRDAYAGGGIVAFQDGGDVDALAGLSGLTPEKMALDALRIEKIERERKRKEDQERLEFLKQAAPEVAERLIKEKQAQSGIQTVVPVEKQEAPAVKEEKKVAAPSAAPSPAQKPPAEPVLSGIEKYEADLKKRGLDVRPETGKAIEAMMKQREMYEAPTYKDWTEGLLGAVQDIRSGQAVGSSRLKQEKEAKEKLSDLNLKIAQAQDLNAKAEYEFSRGNFDKAVEYERQAEQLKNQAMSARASMIQASKPTQIQEQMQLLKTNPELFERMFGKKDPTSELRETVLKEALKGWMDPTNITLRKQYNSFEDYLKTLPYFSQSGTSKVDQNLIKQADAIIAGKK